MLRWTRILEKYQYSCSKDHIGVTACCVLGPVIAGVVLLIKAAKYSCVAVSEVQGPP